MRNYIDVINEIYDEPEDSSFSHNGSEYDLNSILTATQKFETKDINVIDLIWVLEYDPMDDSDIQRIMDADLDAPILVTVIVEDFENKYVVIDGIHRLSKAVITGHKTLPAVVVSQKFIDQFKIT